MKPHLPVRLLRAVVLMATAAPAALYAEYTTPTEIIVPDTYTNSVELSGTAEITSQTESTVYRLTDDVTMTPTGQSYSGVSYLYTSDSAENLASISFTKPNGSTSKAFNVNNPQVTFNSLKDVSFSSFSTTGAFGGAVYVNSTANLLFTNNEGVTFTQNKVAQTRQNAANGGGICVEGAALFQDNGKVIFTNNEAQSQGGAIALDRHSNVTEDSHLVINGNDTVVFDKNQTSNQLAGLGGALYNILGNMQLNHNGNVTFSSNKARATYMAQGGAIYSTANGGSGLTVELSYNKSLIFEGNLAQAGSYNASDDNAYGGAILASGTDVILNSNSSLIFKDNKAYMTRASGIAEGGAIRIGYDAALTIQNNGSVIFENNQTQVGSTTKYNSIYANDSSVLYNGTIKTYELNVDISAPEEGSVEFRDCVYIDVSQHDDSYFKLNSMYTGEDGKTIAQTGEIIFTGEYMTSGDKTSEFKGTASLHDGKLTVKEGAVLKAGTLVVTESVSGESIPTLEVNNATLTANKITLEADTILTNTKGTINGIDDNSLLEIVGGKVENSGTISMNIAMESGELTATDGSAFAGITATMGVINIEGNVTIKGGLELGKATMVSLYTNTSTEGLLIVNLLDATSGINIENVDMLAVGDNVVFNVAVDSFDDLNSNNVLTIFSTENEEHIDITQTITVTDKNNNIMAVTYTDNGDGSVTLSIPEPTTATLSLLALAGLAARRRRK